MGMTNTEKQAAWRARQAANKARVVELEAEVADLRALHDRDVNRLQAITKLYRIDAKTLRAIFKAADEQADELRAERSPRS